MKIFYRWKRWLVRLRRFQGSNSGDWAWIKSKPVPFVALNRDLWRWAEPGLNYYMLLFLSGVISTLGLLANSSATIIGAMIIAPLMGPITSVAFAIAMGNRRLMKRAALTIFSGVMVTILTAALITFLVGLDRLTPEIRIRVQPTLIDLGVALAAGAAGAFAKSRQRVSDALPGVAIAVALVPPLSVIGIGIAMPSRPVALGSTLLFVTNLASVIFSGALIFLWQNYGSPKRARQGLTVSSLILLILGVPLGFSFRDLLLREQTRFQLSAIIQERAMDLGNAEIQSLSVQRQRQQLRVSLELTTDMQGISDQEAELIHRQMEDRLQRDVDLELSVTPIRRFRL